MEGEKSLENQCQNYDARDNSRVKLMYFDVLFVADFHLEGPRSAARAVLARRRNHTHRGWHRFHRALLPDGVARRDAGVGGVVVAGGPVTGALDSRLGNTGGRESKTSTSSS